MYLLLQSVDNRIGSNVPSLLVVLVFINETDLPTSLVFNPLVQSTEGLPTDRIGIMLFSPQGLRLALSLLRNGLRLLIKLRIGRPLSILCEGSSFGNVDLRVNYLLVRGSLDEIFPGITLRLAVATRLGRLVRIHPFYGRSIVFDLLSVHN